MSYVATAKERRVFGRVSLQWMLEVSVPRAVPKIERKERETEALVLRDMPQLVTPDRGRGLHVGDDHMAERDRAEAAPCEHEVCEAAIAHVEKAAIPPPWTSEGEQTHKMADRVRVMRDESPAELQMVATTSSTAARTRARVVSDESKCRVISFSLRSTSIDTTPSILRQPATMCS